MPTTRTAGDQRDRDSAANHRLAIVERDPEERDFIDVVDYYDDSGKLIRREV